MKISTEEKKEIIIQNFISLLHQYGIEKVTLNNVAEKSGLTKSALYYYFDSKESLMIECFKKYHSMMMKKIDSVLKKARDPKEALKFYCDFLFDLPKDKDFTLVMTFSDTVLAELTKYIINVPSVAKEIVLCRKNALDQITRMIAKYVGYSENDPVIKKITLFFNASCSEIIRHLFKIGLSSRHGSVDSEICELETKYKEIMGSMTKEDFYSFVVGGLDALIANYFKDKN